MTNWTKDEINFIKVLGQILNPYYEEERRSRFYTNDGKYFTILTVHDIDMIVKNRLNHNQFEYKGRIFNLKRAQE